MGTKPAFEANLPADFAADRPIPLVGDALRNRASGHAPRLQQDDGTVFDQRRRHARRLAGARLGRDDNCPRSPNSVGDGVDERIDWEGIEARGSGLLDCGAPSG